VLADFGEAKKYRLSTISNTTVVCVGTLDYMSPELKASYIRAQNEEYSIESESFDYFVSDVFRFF
jgi:serine/threonine protein kinase